MNWYCVHTKPLKEIHATRYCETVLGLQTYFPRLRRRRVIRRVRREVTSPLFPRYLFCRFDAASHYRAVRHAPEVLDIVSFGGRPTTVSDDIITQLQEWAGQALDATTVERGLKAGDLVEVVAGPMRGLQAVFLHEMRDSERVAVLLSTLDCGARMTIDRSQLQLVA